MKIKGFGKLTEEQKEILIRVNRIQIEGIGLEYKEDKVLTECWVNENGTVCGRTKGGDWYHYFENGTWG